MNFKFGILVAGLGLIFTLGSCGRESWPCVNGSGPITSEERYLSGFTAISNETDLTVYVSQGPEFAVRVEAQSNLMQEIKTKVSGSTLEIYSDHCINSGEPVIVYVTLPVITTLDISGSGLMYCQTKIVASNLNVDVSGSGTFTGLDSIVAEVLTLDISGSGSMTIQAYVTTASADISGSGSIFMSGSGSTINQEISGSGEMRNFGFLVNSAYVEISGSGNLELNATDLIDGDISGSGNIYYKNTPVINVDMSGSGSLIHIP